MGIFQDRPKEEETQEELLETPEEAVEVVAPPEVTTDRSALNCPDCHGEGLKSVTELCPMCTGTGKVS